MSSQRECAVITGASSGIGRAFAYRLAQEGHHLLLLARREDRLNEIAADIEAHYSVSVDLLVCDLSNETELKQATQAIQARHDIGWLVNNAGFGTMGKFAAVDFAKHEAMVHVHVNAPIQLCHAVLPQMVARQAGTIINVSSVAAFFKGEHNVNYGATKAYLNSFSRSLQVEVGAQGVQVQALCPGFTDTEFHDTAEFSTFRREGVPAWLWMSADETVDYSLWGLAQQKGVVFIPGWRNKLFVMSAQEGAIGFGLRFARHIRHFLSAKS